MVFDWYGYLRDLKRRVLFLESKKSRVTTGQSIQSGTGMQLNFLIPHNLIEEPDFYQVQASSLDASVDFYVTADTTNLIVHFRIAPIVGSDNLIFNWITRV